LQQYKRFLPIATPSSSKKESLRINLLKLFYLSNFIDFIDLILLIN